MRITIDIDDKLGENIKQFCRLNKMTYTNYLSSLIEKQFNIDRFGDLNLKLRKTTEVKPVEVKEEKITETTNVGCNENEQPYVVEEEQNTVFKEEKKKKRQLKVK